jgi:hypothetical protein
MKYAVEMGSGVMIYIPSFISKVDRIQVKEGQHPNIPTRLEPKTRIINRF